MIVLGAGLSVGGFALFLECSHFDLWSNELTITPPDGNAVWWRMALWVVLTLCCWVWGARSLARCRSIGKAEAFDLDAKTFAPLLVLGVDLAVEMGLRTNSVRPLFLAPLTVGVVGALKWAEFSRPRASSRRRNGIWLAGGALVFLLVYGSLAIIRYRNGIFGYNDTGRVAESLWNTLHGRPFHCNVYPGFGSYLGDHLYLVLVLLLPFYWLAPHVETLLVLQVLSLAAGGIGTFLLAREICKHDGLARAMALAYWLHPATGHMTSNVSGGVKLVTFAVPLLLFGLWFLLRGRMGWGALFLFLALLCKETVAVVVFALGPLLWRKTGKRGWAVGISLLGLGWLLFAHKAALPYFRQGHAWHGGQFWRGDLAWRHGEFWGNVSGGIEQIAFYVSRHPVHVLARCAGRHQLIYLAHLFVPFGALACLAPVALSPAGISLFFILMSDSPGLHSILLHYTSSMFPFFVLASCVGARKVAGWRVARRLVPGISLRRSLVGAYVAGAALGAHLLFAPSPFSRSFDTSILGRPAHVEALDTFRPQIPVRASVAATAKAALRFVNQRDLYVLPKGLGNAEVVVVDLNEPSGKWDEAFQWRDEILRARNRKLTAFDAGVLVFVYGPNNVREIAERFRIVPPSEASAVAANNAIACVETGVVERNGGLRLKVVWRCLRRTNKDYAAFVHFDSASASQRAVKGPVLPLEGALPTSFWQPGDVFCQSLALRLPADVVLAKDVKVSVRIVERRKAPFVVKALEETFGDSLIWD